MSVKAYEKLVTLGSYKKIAYDDTIYFISTNDLGPVTWDKAQKYEPLTLLEMNTLPSNVCKTFSKYYYWTATEEDKGCAYFKNFTEYRHAYTYKEDLCYVRMVKRFKV